MTAVSRLKLDALVIGPLRHAAGRTLLAVMVIALGVALGFAVALVNRSAAAEVSLAARSLFGLADLVVTGPRAGFDEALFPAVARLPGVALVNPVVDVEARVVGRQGTLTVLGLDLLRASRMQPSLGFETPRTDLAVLESDVVFLSPAAARDLDLADGEELVLQAGLDAVRLRVAGILPAAALRQRAAVLDIGTAQWRFGQLGVLQRLEIRLQPGADPDTVQRAIGALLPAGVEVTSPGAATDEALRLSRAYRSNLTALALVALFTGAFLVHSTQSLAVIRRWRELGFLHALGVTAREQIAATMAGGMVVGIAGSAAGIALGFVIARIGLGAFGGDLGAGYFRGVTPELEVQPLEAGFFFLLGVAAAAGGSLRPALAAARVPAAVALKAGDPADGAVRGSGLAGALLWVLAGALLLAPPIDGLPLAGYTAIALALIGAVLLMPVAMRVLLVMLPAARQVPWQIALAHLRGTARQATTSLSAILVSFSLMVAMAVMVTSFRTSLDLWLEKILPADLYLRTGTATETAYLDAAALERLRTLAGVRTVVANRFTDLAVPGARAPVTLIARPITEADAERTLWIEALAAKPAATGTVPVWISEAAADLLGMAVDDEFTAPLATSDVRFSVRGIYRDYERQNGSLVVDRDTYVKLTGDQKANAAWLWLEEGTAVTDVVAAIRAQLPTLGEYDVRQPGEIRQITLRIFDRTFAVTYLLEIIAVLIGLTGIAASASASVLARRAELGMLRHLGVTRGQTGTMLAAEGAVLGTAGVLAGLVMGILVSLILIYVVNRQSFHWSMDVFFPGTTLTTLSLLLIVAAAVTAVWSGRLALRDDVVRAVKEDW